MGGRSPPHADKAIAQPLALDGAVCLFDLVCEISPLETNTAVVIQEQSRKADCSQKAFRLVTLVRSFSF